MYLRLDQDWLCSCTLSEELLGPQRPTVVAMLGGCPGIGDATSHEALLCGHKKPQESHRDKKKKSHGLAEGGEPGQMRQ